MDWLQCTFYGFLIIMGCSTIIIILQAPYDKLRKFWEIVGIVAGSLVLLAWFLIICWFIGSAICGKFSN